MPQATKEDLERDIFGDDSELSEEEEVPPRQRQARAQIERDEYSSAGESSDAFVNDDAPRAKPPKPRRRTRRDDDERPQKRKRKQTQLTEEDLADLPPEIAAKKRREMQLDAIIKPKKSNRQKKRKKDDEDVLDRFADEEVSRLREAMLSAAVDDEQANRDKLPATNKLRLLPQVMEVLRKQSLSQSIMDNNLLEGVKRWLEPLPDRSLPALNIQRDFFPLLRKMEFIDSAVLRESQLGKVVLFYTKCKRVTPDVQRIANELVTLWSRPIIKRSASYRDRTVPVTALEAAAGGAGGAGANEKLNAILARAKEVEKNRVRKNAVAIPEQRMGSYTVAPRADAGIMNRNDARSSVVQADTERRRKNAERLRSLSRKVGSMKG